MSTPIDINPLTLAGQAILVNTGTFQGPYAVGKTAADCAGLSGVVLPSGTVSSGVAFTMDATHNRLATLTWNGTSFVDTADNPLLVEIFGHSSGRLSNTASSTVTSGSTITYTYSWGVITTTFAASGNNLNVTVTIQNTLVSDTIYRYWFYPTAIQFPSTPTNLGGINISTSGDYPGTIYADFTTGVCAANNLDTAIGGQPVQSGVGFYQVTSPIGPKWYLVLYVDSSQTSLPGTPAITRDIPAGTTATFHYQLAFGRPKELMQNVGTGVFSTYSVNFPQVAMPLGFFPIAMLSFGGRVRPFPATNPRCWFNGSAGVDVTTTPGIAAFQSSLTAAIQAAITEMTRVSNAINAPVRWIWWDPEGYETDQTYIGSPNLITQFAPELAANSYFPACLQPMLNAGFEGGFTLRPQNTTITTGVLNCDGASPNSHLTYVSGSNFNSAWVGDPAGGAIAFGVNNYTLTAATSTTATIQGVAPAGSNLNYVYATQPNTNHLTVLTSKIAAARAFDNRLKHYYIDTTSYGNNNLTPAETYASLQSTYPTITMAPENIASLAYAYSYPFLDSRAGRGLYFPADAITNMAYPGAMGSVRVETDANIDATLTQLVQVITYGGNLIFEGWYKHHANDVVIQAYNAVTPPPVPPPNVMLKMYLAYSING